MDSYKEKYKLLYNFNSNNLSDDVNRHLNSGYKLYGNPYSLISATGSMYHYQAVILDDGIIGDTF